MPLWTAAEIFSYLEGRKVILNVGPSFNGKTRSLWTLAAYLKEHNLGPLRLIDLDLKCESLIEALMNEPEAKSKKLIDHVLVHRIQPTKPSISSSADKVTKSKLRFQSFQNEFNSIVDQIDPRTGTWKEPNWCGALFFDSLTELNKIVEQFVAATIGHDLGAEKTDARNDYTKIMNKVEEIIDESKQFPCIIGWIAHEQTVQSETDGKIIVLPAIVGKHTLAPALAKKFNCMLFSTRLEQKDKPSKFMWQTKPEGWVRSAGVTSRSDLPTFIDQDYRKIL